jgi:hypothetical protein
MKTITHQVDFCVVGGGMAGLCAAVAAARNGLRTILMHDRPVLGGNASSEIRMWICGAHGEHLRETGIIEEILLDNRFRNPGASYAMWDALLHEKVAFQENLTPLLNCSCNDAVMDGDRIVSVKGWQLTTETWHVVEATMFADCSGDSILAPLTGAEFRQGREAAAEFGESIAPATADRRTMGMSCLLQARETSRPQPFIPPPWAHTYPDDASLPHRGHDMGTNFWWIEIGGEGDSVHDAEKNRDELLKIAYGVWDHIKNRGDHGADNWELEWVGFLPGKRESRRYVGDHILTQNDVRAEGRFDDLIAYGGWSMDDHHPAGIRHPGEPTIFHPAPSPYGIPYRCVYSRNLTNLFFAGRNISATHAAMSSTRVMATCATLGQAVGVAASLAVRHGLSPRGVHEQGIATLKQKLMTEDSYLPWNVRAVGETTRTATLKATSGDPEPLRNGIDRPVGKALNAWRTELGGHVEMSFPSPRKLAGLRLVFDSDLSGGPRNMPAMRPLDFRAPGPPPTLVREFRIEAAGADGIWQTVAHVTDNHQRLVHVDLAGIEAMAIRLTLDASWGNKEVNVFAMDVDE